MTDAATKPAATVLPGRLRPNPAGIITPRKHGEILINPPLPVLREALADPSTMPGAVTGFPPDAWHVARHETAAAAAAHAHALGLSTPMPARQEQAPWVVTGHQVEFYHAGVWAKVVCASALGRQTGACAVDLLVDHDVLEHLGFMQPYRERNHWHKRLVAWSAAAPVTPAECIPAPGQEAFTEFMAAALANPVAQGSETADYLHAMASAAPAAGYVQRQSFARQQVEKALQVRAAHVPFSMVAAGRAWHLFVAIWLQNAESWAHQYNQALQRYRRRTGTRNPSQPMPDLLVTPTQVELPFWIYRDGQPRSRLVLRQGQRPNIFHDDQRIDLSAVLREKGWGAAELLQESLLPQGLHVRPRALALTMFVRLFIANLFIHGIGGALYDQITDDFMERVFGAAPAYACVSAAWLLPLAADGAVGENLPQLRWQLHHLLHNPGPAIDGAAGQSVGLLRQRQELVDRIAASLRDHRRERVFREQRRKDFRELHAINARLHAIAPAATQQLRHAISRAVEAASDRAVTHNREWFFALHQRASLEQLVAAFAGPA